MRLIRLVLINLGVLLVLWMGLLLGVTAVSDISDLTKRLSGEKADERPALPNYPDHAAAARIYEDTKKTEDGYVPFAEWRRKPLTSENVNIDADGYRTHTIGIEGNDPAATDIGFFGGSTMWGTGTDDNGTIPAIFDKLTTAYRVTNYGESGYISRQNLETLINLMNEGKAPKTVVFYDGVNDVQILCNQGFTHTVNGHHEEQHLREMVADRQSRKSSRVYYYLIDPIVEAFGFGDHPAGREYICALDKAKAQAVAETLVRNWEIAHQLVTAYGGRFFAFLQPVAFVGHPKIDYLKLRRDSEADFLAVYPLIKKRLAERGDDWATDVSDLFDRDEAIFVDDAHVSANGNALVAARMRDRIAAGPVSSANP
jgi:hypothetical protein